MLRNYQIFNKNIFHLPSKISSQQLTMSPFVLQRKFSNDYQSHVSTPNHYALILSGGKITKLNQSFTEYSFSQTAKEIYFHLSKSDYFTPDSIKILYGAGPSVKVNSIIPSFPICQIKFDSPVANENSIKGFEEELKMVSSKLTSGDHLVIFILGHGGKFKGTTFYQGDETHLSPLVLEEALQKINANVNIIIYVESCYSSNYLKMKALKNVTVFTSAPIDQMSWYYPDRPSKAIPSFLKYFCCQDHDNLLLLHSAGHYNETNFCSENSLQSFLENRLKQYGYPLNELQNEALLNVYYRFMFHVHRTQDNYNAFKAFSLSSLLINPFMTGLLYAYSLFKEIQMFKYYNRKDNTNFKIFCTNEIKKSDEKLINHCKTLVSFIEEMPLHANAGAYLKGKSDEIQWVLSKLLEIKQTNLTPSDQTLLIKSLLFLKFSLLTGQIDQVNDFLNLAQRTLDPLNKNALYFKPKVIERWLARDSFFKQLPIHSPKNTSHEPVKNRTKI